MAMPRVTVTIERELLEQLDQQVALRVFANRSKGVQIALRGKLAQLRHERLARECAKLDPHAEQSLAEEAIGLDLAKWPEY